MADTFELRLQQLEQQTAVNAQLINTVLGLQQSAVGNQVALDEEAIDQEYWDTMYLDPALNRQQITFFQSDVFPAGSPAQAGVQKNAIEFNLPTPGKFTSPQSYTISYIRLSVMSLIAGDYPIQTDLEQLRAWGLLTYVQGSKNVWNKPLEEFSDAGFYGYANAGANGGILNYGPFGIMDFELLNPVLPQIAGFGFGFTVSVPTQFVIENALRLRLTIGGRLVNTRN